MSDFPKVARAQADTNEIPQIHPFHPEIPPTFWELHGTLILLAGLLALTVIGLGVWLATRPKPPVVVPPADQARAALQALPVSASEVDKLSRIGQILRAYILAEFNLPQAELTTTEFCRVVAAHEPIGPALALALAAFLQENDRRKFSPAPAAAPTENPLTRALTLIDQAEARRRRLPAPANPASPA